jgi:indole-3-glycerol phosphate synthase
MMLDTLVASSRALTAQRKCKCPAERLEESLPGFSPVESLLPALRRPGVSVIAEIKRASPSKGDLAPRLDPASLAVAYAGAGADAISVLTEPTRFLGSLDDLAGARTSLRGARLACPLLRKDFIVDDYQLLEARIWGADAALLIAAALDDASLAHLFERSLSLGLTPLIEVHDSGELMRVLPLHPPLIGINNRNLQDFSVSLDITHRLRPLIPPGCVVVSESGIHHPTHMRALAELGVDAALIGEALVTAPDPAARLRELREAGR